MHELPVTENLLEIAIRHANKAEATRILSLNIVIGQYASIVDDSIQFYWDIITDGTLAQGANLNFHRISAEFRCMNCHHCFSPVMELLPCPVCGSSKLDLISGAEFFLESIEVE